MARAGSPAYRAAMRRRTFLRLSAATCLTVALATGCDGSDDDAPDPRASQEPDENENEPDENENEPDESEPDENEDDG